MGNINTLTKNFVMNNRWLFDVNQDRLIDLNSAARHFSLKPVAARILTVMADSPRILLRRRDLFDFGWRAFGFEVCENSLNQVMCTLRNTFATIDPGVCYIKTVPRVGYCLLADIRAPNEQECSLLKSLEAPPDAKEGKHDEPLTAFSMYGWPRSDRIGQYAFADRLSNAWRNAQRSGLPLSLLIIHVRMAAGGADVGREMSNIAYPRKKLNPGNGTAERPHKLFVGQCVAPQLHRPGDELFPYDPHTVVAILLHTPLCGADIVARNIQAATQQYDCRGSQPSINSRLTIRIVSTQMPGVSTLDKLRVACATARVEAELETQSTADRELGEFCRLGGHLS
ncbi:MULTISPECIES: helix-turn-helix domain-containing protein [unclassified Caballeronia]|uniref:winged helix-turn-helix domain-containing protein n=1 Tax=unclassified Caballeronia TaxID=2646786 RepID=UPI0020287DB3|nr:MULTISPECIES: helix-turn-helix domain-containing protein [unclassified Caballeronia]